MFRAVNSGNLDKVKKYTEPKNLSTTSIPVEAIETLEGFDDDEPLRVKIEVSNQYEEFDTEMMNPIELAAVKGQDAVLSHLVNVANFRKRSEFTNNWGSIETMPFIFAPILSKNSKVVKILLDVANLWSMDELKQIAVYMKHVNWPEGIKIVLASTALHQ